MLRVVFFLGVIIIFSIFQTGCCKSGDCESYTNLFSFIERNIEDLEFTSLNTFQELQTSIPVGKNTQNGIIEVSSNGQFLFMGTSRDTNILFVLVNPDGEVEPQNIVEFDTLPKGYVHHIVEGHSNEYVAVGSTVDQDMFILKVDTLANVKYYKEFKQFFNNSNPPYYGPSNVVNLTGLGITSTSDFGYVVTGYYRQDIGNDRLFTLKVKESEDTLDVKWLRTYFDNSPTYGRFIKEQDDGSLIISGYRHGQLAVFKMNELGHSYWIKLYYSSFSGYGSNLLLQNDNKAITIGTSEGTDSRDIFVTEVNTNTSLEEANGFFGEESGKNDVGYLIAPTVDEDVYAVLGRNHLSQLYFFKVKRTTDNEYTRCVPDLSNEVKYCFEHSNYNTFAYEIPSGIFQLKHKDHFNGYLICTIVSDNDEDYFLRLIKTDAEGKYF